ncbi:MAG: hypothetical protein ACR2RL_22780, partial [Gammaproteobacteria bacterium]
MTANAVPGATVPGDGVPDTLVESEALALIESDTLDLAKVLIARPSVTPADAGCLELIAARLKHIGFAARPMQFGEVSNLWARRGEAGPVLCFLGHTDVVPPGKLEQWH